MRWLSLFDGISCGRVAIERAGLPCYEYVAFEIDASPIHVSQWNWPDIKHKGSVVGADFTKYKGFDVLMGGSPCQGFSFAGKQLNFEDPRSKLFFEFVRALNEAKPKYFLLENVLMKQKYQDIISDFLGVKPIRINSALVSAQMRKRLYWTNIPGIEQPKDKGILLRDILENATSSKDKSFCITAGQQKKTFDDFKFKSLGNFVEVNPADSRGRYLNKATIVGRRLDENGTRKDYDKNVPITQVLEVRATNTDKSNCLTTVEKDNVLTYLPPGRYPDVYKNKIPYRKLTPLECERLQTLPDNYTDMISNAQRFKALGNGWTVDVIAHILQNIHLDLLL